MQTYMRLLRYMKPYIGRVLWAVFFMILTAGLTAASMYIIKPVIDKILANSNKAEAMSWMRVLPFAIMGVFALKGLCSYAQNYLVNYIGSKIILNMRNELYAHITGLSMKFFNNNKIGILISRITSDVGMIQGALANFLGNVVGAVLTIGGLVGMLFYLSWKFALITMAVFPLAILPFIKFSKKIKSAASSVQAKMGDITSILNETFNGIRIVKAFGMEKYERKRFEEELNRYFADNHEGDQGVYPFVPADGNDRGGRDCAACFHSRLGRYRRAAYERHLFRFHRRADIFIPAGKET